MASPNTSSSTALALLATLAAAALWAVLAWRTPTSTFHFAPLIAVAVGPYIAKARSGPLSPAAATPVVGMCFAATALAVAVLAATDHMQGPTFWSEDGAALEAALFTVVGAIIGFGMLSRGSQPSQPS